MSGAVRLAFGNARMHALKGTLWRAGDLQLLLHARTDPRGHPLNDSLDVLFPPLVQWYVTLLSAYPDARDVLLALLGLHEIENLKLLWRAAARPDVRIERSWRPLEPLGLLSPADRASSRQALCDRLEPTPYGRVLRAALRSPADEVPSAEIGFDRWACERVHEAAMRLPSSEAPARALIHALLRERDVDLLRRGVSSFGLAPDLAAKSTTVLSRECGVAPLAALAAWTPAAGPLAPLLPTALIRAAGPAADWDALVLGLRRGRLRACRRAFVAWPFQLAPACAALLLREEQVRAVLAIAAAGDASAAGTAALTLALAAGALEA